MVHLVLKVNSKQEAIKAIEGKTHEFVELDYEYGALDLFALAKLGRQNSVSVQYISQETIKVKSEDALKRNLSEQKDSFKQRFIYLEFDIKEEKIKEYQLIASRTGDTIIGKGFDPLTTAVWE